MTSERQEYKGRGIELRRREEEREEEFELLVDDEPIRYGQLPDGRYFMYEYAYDWTDDLMDLARKLVDYRDRADAIAKPTNSGK